MRAAISVMTDYWKRNPKFCYQILGIANLTTFEFKVAFNKPIREA